MNVKQHKTKNHPFDGMVFYKYLNKTYCLITLIVEVFPKSLVTFTM
jgi:hypothetical protein